jgi:HPt (histidine-containing phosphotransfer) domain-containing protein
MPGADATGIPFAAPSQAVIRCFQVAGRLKLDRDASVMAAAHKESPMQGQEFRDVSSLEPLSPEVLDRDALRASVGEDPGALLDLVTRFLAESQAMLEGLRRGVSRGDTSALEQGAHRLEGSLREVAATAARTAARHLEAAARAGDLATAADVMFTLEDEIARLEPQLASLRSDR